MCPPGPGSYRRCPPGGVRSRESRCAEVKRRGELGCFRRGSERRRRGCGNAAAGGGGHCWTLGGDVRTRTGAPSGWLPSNLAGCSGDVRGSPGQADAARSVFPSRRCTGAFLPCADETEAARSRGGFPSTMEPRTAGGCER
ncbi:hypothetical protein Q5P01_025482 [Channa striata]|uniref:Uncharacterized protein n=1 Tax=Channa striata TaxID=64152 RepID=A0AA88LLR2_CHASR|nr:hypothetical protein Q5P01_025482 [Channa striata]